MRPKETKINNSFDDSYYQVLDLEPGATDKEIEDAFRRIKNNFSVNAIASHSLFSQEEKRAVIEKATEAYKVLISHKDEHINAIDGDNHNQQLIMNGEKILFGGVESDNKIKLDSSLKGNKINTKKTLYCLP